MFVAELLGAARPAWTPHEDPRVAALAAGYQFLLDAAARRGFGCRAGTTGQRPAMRVALYARVSTEAQADRGTIGSQLALLRDHITAADDELVGEYVDDGHSGARLDRPGLDALRDAAEAGLIQRVWCLSPDRLARAYAYQVLVLDELDRFGVTVAFTDSPGLAADDPQATLLTQVQGVIAEYEKAKIAERYRRGKLFRARAGEIVTWKSSYGYRRIRPQRRHRPSAPRDLRARGRGGAADLHRPRRRHHRARDLPPPQRRRDTVTDRQTHLGALHAVPAAAQRGLRRAGLLQPHRIGARPAPHPPHPAGPPRPRRMDPDRLPPHRLR